MAFELRREQVFDKARRGRFVERIEAGAREGLRIRLDDPGRALRFVLIAMRDENAVLGLAKEERERVERPGRSHPGKEVRAQIDARLELIRKGLAKTRIDAVRGHHEIRIQNCWILR